MPNAPQAKPDTTDGIVRIVGVDEMRDFRNGLAGKVALVPTMGALHEGHLQHIRVCLGLAQHVIVSVFVNPTQFNEQEDFRNYPRTLETDIALCAEAGASVVFAPTPEALYPPTQVGIEIDAPTLSNDLEGRDRPGHFQGVCRVVAKLLNIVRPDFASFGRKDYQQLCIVQAMVADLMLPVRIVQVPTLREPDGLAMSSRNQRIEPDQRQRAVGLFKSLNAAKQLVEQDGETDPDAVEQAMRAVLRAHQVEVGYAVVRHPQTLGELSCVEPALTGGVIALVAGRVGAVRLIDNMLLGAGADVV